MELFDMVKAAPPPLAISATERMSTTSPIPPESPDANDAVDDDDDLPGSDKANAKGNKDEHKKDNNKRKASLDKIERDKDDDGQPAKGQIDTPPLLQHKQEDSSTFKVSKKLKKFKQMKEDTVLDAKREKEKLDKTEEQKKRRTSNELLEDNDDTDASSDGGYPKSIRAPTKTKAQQKMFNDLPDPSASPNLNQKCIVRLRRLSQSIIEAAVASISNSKFSPRKDSAGMRKRGRPIKSSDNKKSPSPAKKLKVSLKSNFHIKVPLKSWAQNRALQTLPRICTPPPILSSRQKPKPKSKQLGKGPKVSPKMIRRYGSHVFNCVVRIRRTPWPSKTPEVRLGGVRKKRPRKSNLTVSFSEAVEILGSNESGTRRSTFGTISSKSPKPTRLQRVDATGNVLEDIALTSNLLLTGNSTAASSSSGGSSGSGTGSRGKGKRRSCNGTPRLKRPHQRIPLSGLASLRLDDGPKSDDADEEYIVPNELPGIQRSGTPTPRRKKISFTTTISDDEDDDKPPPKKSKSKSKPKPSTKRVEKSTSLKESVLQKGMLQTKSNEIVKEKLEEGEAAVIIAQEVAENEDEQVGVKISKVADEATNKEENGAEPANPKAVDIVEDKPEAEAGKTALETETGEDAGENGESNPEEMSNTNCETFTEDDMSTLEVTQSEFPEEVDQDDAKEVEQDEDADNVEVFRELHTPASQTLAPMTEEATPDDVLEIQTSLEDVRQLHTPFSSQESTPQAPGKIARHDSVDSDCSFKSATEPIKDAQARVNEERDEADAARGTPATVSEIDPAVLTPPPVARTINGCDPASAGSNISTAYYSPIETMPTLDDEVLGHLVEPDFQLNSSRHAISRGTLDDIMTALES